MRANPDLTMRIRGSDLHDVDLADLSRSLRDDLLLLDIDDARPATGGSPPDNAKAGEAITIGSLVVTLGPVLLGAVVDVAASWLRRQPDTVELEIGGHRYKGRVTAEQRKQLVEKLIKQLSDK